MTIIVTDPSPSPGRRALYPALELDSGTELASQDAGEIYFTLAEYKQA
jgi:hypothetical protein